MAIFPDTIQQQQQSLDRQDRRTNQRLMDLLSILGGNNTSQNNNAAINIQDLFQSQDPSLSRDQAIADTQGLVAASVRQFQQSILPQLTGAAEGAGTRGDTITALLAQEAGAAQAGQVAQLQAGQINANAELRSRAKDRQVNVFDILLRQIAEQERNRTQLATSSLARISPANNRARSNSIDATRANVRLPTNRNGSFDPNGAGSGLFTQGLANALQLQASSKGSDFVRKSQGG